MKAQTLNLKKVVQELTLVHLLNKDDNIEVSIFCLDATGDWGLWDADFGVTSDGVIWITGRTEPCGGGDLLKVGFNKGELVAIQILSKNDRSTSHPEIFAKASGLNLEKIEVFGANEMYNAIIGE